MEWLREKVRIKANRGLRAAADFVADHSRGRLVNINSRGRGLGIPLSNFTEAPFTLHGVRWQSFEGFWQGIKFPEGSAERIRAQALVGMQAKKLAKGIRHEHVFYGGRKISYGSPELYGLAKQAQRARFEQNPAQRQALIATGKAKLIHFVEVRDSKDLPRKWFCRMLTELRKEYATKEIIR